MAKEFLTKVYSKIEYLYCKLNKYFESQGIILMFHHVTDEPVDIIECCKCKTNRFKEIIEEVKKNYDILAVDEIGKKHLRKYAIITFDDGCEDVFLNAYPFLKANDIPFVVYITSSWIDKEGYLSKNQLMILDKDPLVTIGFHTTSHPQLRYVSNIKQEMITGRGDLEKILGHEVCHFAFPYGKLWSVGPMAVLLGLFSDYKTVMSTFDTHLSTFTLLFQRFLPRTIIM